MRYMNRTRLGVFVLAILTAVGAAGVWLYAQPRVATGTFGPTAANPAYIVVNTATPVVFTAQITDPQLKKRSVVLVRLDDAGQPSDIVGRLRDDGKNGDTVAGDKTYSLRTNLNEPVVGPVNFKIAARFKPGRWQEPEADDDDWDQELASVSAAERDRPAERTKREKRLKRLARYSLSGSIVVTVDPFKLPPDPGEAGKQTLAGIDSDNDGVRDDVQRWIGLLYSDLPTASQVITRYAIVSQQMLGAGDTHTALDINDIRRRASACWRYHYPQANSVLEELKSVLLNTDQRLSAYLRADQLVAGREFKNLPLNDPSVCN